MLTRRGSEWKKFQSSDSCTTDLKEKPWMAAMLQPWTRRVPLLMPEVPHSPGCFPLHSSLVLFELSVLPKPGALERALTARKRSGQSCARHTGKDHHGRRNSHDQLAWPAQATATPPIPVWTQLMFLGKKPSLLGWIIHHSPWQIVPTVNYPTL